MPELAALSKDNSLIPNDDPAVAGEGAGITIRSILVGAVLCVVLSVAAPYNITNLQGSFLALDHNATGAIALFFIFVAVANLLLRLVAKACGNGPLISRLPFRRAEMLTIYVMLVVSGALCTMGLGVQLPPIITAPLYHQYAGETWATFLAKSDVTLPSWLIVSDTEAVRTFYSGLGRQDDFWPQFLEILCRHWLRPMAFWGIFLFSLYTAMVCVAVIIRKQWMEREILAYPLAKVPLAMSESGPGNKLVSPLFRNKLTWIGFAIPFVIGVLVALRRYLPGFPEIQLSRNARLLDDLVIVIFALSFAGIGFAYLVNLEISFSVWFFGLLGIATVALMRFYGVQQFFGLPLDEYLGGFGVPSSPLIYHLGMGAMLCMVAYGLWITRDHLRDVFAKALGRAPDVDDSQEILSYRKAVFGLLASVIIMLVWLCWAGMALWLAVVFLAGMLTDWLWLQAVFWGMLFHIVTDLIYLYVQGRLFRRALSVVEWVICWRRIQQLGWQPKYNELENIISSAWNWHSKYPGGYPK